MYGGGAMSEQELTRLKASEVVVEDTRLDESGGSVRVTILVQAPAERIWNVISRCQYAHRYLVGLKECEILVDEPLRALTRHVIDSGLFAPRLDYTFETLREPYLHMDIKLVEGNLKRVDGYWHYEPFEGGVLLEHEVHVQAATPAPRWIIRRKLKRDLPRMMSCIRGLAGGSADSEVEARDLGACQVPSFIQD